jgi:Asp-tRNA(Asn)/Glu-tRNA(Gln) amidotransferase A subunit family amidase
MMQQDIYYLKGKTITFGYVAWKDKVATEDANIVKACRDAGCKIIQFATLR